ncbi:helix-turn-helix domain-containing protein [Bacteroides fragilis]|jgi:transcriptional regulator with XRE-family HTH domain|uniref:Helix-turn-helix domain protein n=1 Tax=Siphoviridae sp. ct4Uy2 TaxID=2827777 RepID=A0A8S5SJG0_9CAUD|nr:MAG TPA: helix-turn-helix domain protein [Siphoviridae sp. ct4Uy2]
MRIREAIEQQGMTTQDVAKKIGITLSGLNQHISGNPSIKVLAKIAEAINVPMWQLFASPEEVAQQTKSDICPHCGQPIVVKTTIEKG